MTEPLEVQVLALFLLFCRLAGCLLFAPGLSSPRVAIHVRLFAALAITASLSPLLISDLANSVASVPDQQRVLLIARETMTGVLIGLMARCFFLALQFSATAISNFIGLSGIPGIPLEESDTGSPLATLVSSAAVTMIFVLGLHIELLRAVMDSYSVIPVGRGASFDVMASSLLHTLGETWLLALRLSGPFLVYGVIVNFALGIGNRFAQQVSIYHATTGAVMLGGFLLFYMIWIDWVMVFTEGYRAWLVEGGF